MRPNKQSVNRTDIKFVVGFVGRHLALHIHKNNLASELRIVDKLLPQLAWLAPEFEEACSKEQFVQADASRERTSTPPFSTIKCI
jgi:nucleoside-diphosphate-sugar epimerase